MARSAGLVLAGLLSACSIACSVDASSYASRLFTCDITRADADQSCGAGWGCFGAAHQLGAPDFCAPTCDPSQPSPDGACSDGLFLPRCDPTSAGSCPPEQACIRTDLESDQGVCLPLAPCTTSVDCHDPVRSECSAEVMAAIYPQLAARTDHLYCMQAGCAARAAACAPGSTCLAVQLARQLGMDLPDLCVPDCDSRGRCPPDFVCSSKVFPAILHPFCLPGLVGLPCSAELDCLAGSCQTLADQSICVAPCTTDEQCAGFVLSSFRFACYGGRCLAPTSFFLRFCDTTAPAACPSGLECRLVGDVQAPTLGYCIRACQGAGDCPQADLPQACVGGACLPAFFGAPCTSAAGCLPGLDCLQPTTLLPARICSVACPGGTNEECQSNPRTGKSSYCVAALFPNQPKVCAPKLGAGGGCVSPLQCLSNACSGGVCL